MTKDFDFASASKSILYWLYFSNLKSLLNPDGLSFSLGILKNIESPWVALTCVWGVMFSITLCFIEIKNATFG
jgi:hypothetical protein